MTIYFDLNRISIHGLETPELEHARWAYSRDVWRLRLSALWFTTLYFGAAALMLGAFASITLGAAWAAGQSVGRWGFPVGALTGSVVSWMAFSRTEVDDWFTRVGAAGSDAWSLYRTHRATLRDIRTLLRERRDGRRA